MTHRITVNADTSSILGSEDWTNQEKQERGSNSHNRLVRMPVRFLAPILMFGVPAGCAGFALLLGLAWREVLGWGLMAFGPAALSVVLVYLYLDASYKRGDWDNKRITLEKGRTVTPPPVVAAPTQTVRSNGGKDVRQIERESPYTWHHDGRSYHFSGSQIAALKERVGKRSTRLAASVLGMDAAVYSEYMAVGQALGYVVDEGSDSKSSYYLTPDGCTEWLGLPYPS